MEMKMKNRFSVVGIFIVAVCVVFVLLAGFGVFGIDLPTEYKEQYNCDYKVISLNLNVDVVGTNGNDYNIRGEVLSTYEDDLVMKNADGDIVKVTDDKFNFISQNNHIIMSGDTVEYICDGQIKIFADSYNIYDADENKVAYVYFNILDTVGIMKDMAGNEIARYDSAAFRKDYVVTIFDDCEIDSESILMIFGSYVSDKRADDSNN